MNNETHVVLIENTSAGSLAVELSEWLYDCSTEVDIIDIKYDVASEITSSDMNAIRCQLRYSALIIYKLQR